MINYTYNGTELSMLPSAVWKFTYIYIAQYRTRYHVRAFNEIPQAIDKGTSVCYSIESTEPFTYFAGYTDDAGKWITSMDQAMHQEYDMYSKDGSELSAPIIWSNHDIIDLDGSVWLAASNPIPVSMEPDEYKVSEYYKYLILRKLRRHLAMNKASERAYTQNFYGKLLDGIALTNESYSQFSLVMAEYLEYCANNDIWGCFDITHAEVNEKSQLLIDAFAAIGILLDIKLGNAFDDTTSTLTFTKPTSEQLTYQIVGGLSEDGHTNYFKICSKSQTEYNYAKLSTPYYNWANEAPFELDMYNPMVAGPDTYWKYNEETATMTITGSGTYAGAPTDPQVGAGTYTILIIGAEVSCLAKGSLEFPDIETLVLLHPADFPLVISDLVVPEKTSYSWVVYTDSEVFRNHAWDTNMSIEWHSLSEWGE